jgi:alkylhydroperoxidase family enzyme
MPRIPFVSADLDEPAAIVDAIRKRRGGKLLDLDRMLLNSPALAAGWNVYLGAVREQLTLAPKLRELAICGVAALNRADYEFVHHAPLFVREGGTQAQVEALKEFERASSSILFDATERAVIRLTLEMTRNVEVHDETFAAAAKALGSPQAMVELVASIATYNMVSRFLVALAIQPE